MDCSSSFLTASRKFATQHQCLTSHPVEFPHGSAKGAFMSSCLDVLQEDAELAWDCLRICCRSVDDHVNAFATVANVRTLLSYATSKPSAASVMALRCLMNLLHSCDAAYAAFSSLDGTIALKSLLSTDPKQLTSKAILYSTRLIYMLSSLRSGVASQIAHDTSFLTSLIALLPRLFSQYNSTYAPSIANAMSEIMKLLYTLSSVSPVDTSAPYIIVLSDYLLAVLLCSDATLLECHEHAVQLLTISALPVSTISSRCELADVLLRLLDAQLWRAEGEKSNTRVLLLTPILGVLTDFSSRCDEFKASIRRKLNLTTYEETTTLSSNLTLLRRVMQLLLEIEPYSKRYANEFLYVLCDRNGEKSVVLCSNICQIRSLSE